MESAFIDNLIICETETDFNVKRDRSSNLPPPMSEKEYKYDFFHKFKNITSEDVGNTFKYMFHKFKKGIYVKIKDGNMVNFLLFDNMQYVNEFSHLLKPPPNYETLEEFLTAHGQAPRTPPHKWYANNSMFRTDDFKGQNNTEIIHKWLTNLCAGHKINDIEFFINRRDFPILNREGKEPYDHIFNDTPLVSHNYEKYAPIISFSSGEEFADIMMPTFEDWARAWFQEDGVTSPKLHRMYPKIKSIPWNQKKPLLFFRGQTTGSGFDENTNQRLRAFAIGNKNKDIMDIQFNKISRRFRKHRSSPYIHIQKIPKNFSKAKYTTAQDQSAHKFILTLEGHVAAYRLSYELSMGSCILLAGSRWKMWYMNRLKPWVHYIPVLEDLSDLVSKTKWCLDNDETCEVIAKNAKTFFKTYLNATYMMDYSANVLNNLAMFCGSFEHVPMPEMMYPLEPWQVSRHDHMRMSVLATLDKIHAKKNFTRSIENLQAVELIVCKYFDSLRFTSQQDGITFINMFGCLIRNQTDNLSEQEATVARQVGYFCVNKVLHDIPNFTYTFPVKTGLLTELMCGISMDLFTKHCSEEDFKSVIFQTVCALAHIQTKTGFVHGSLTKENLLIVPLKEPMTVSYQMISSSNIVHTTNFLCIIKDFHHARGVAYDIDRNLVVSVGDLRTPAIKSLDIRTLYESMSKIPGRLLHVISALAFGREPQESVEMMMKMGISKTIWDSRPFSVMQNGNLVYRLARMRGLSNQEAMKDTFEYILGQGTFDTDLCFFEKVGKELFRHRNKWLHERMLASPLQNHWLKFLSKGETKTRKTVFPGFSYPGRIYNEPVNDYSITKTEGKNGDWVSLLDLVYFAFRMNILPKDIPNLSLFHCDGFELLVNIALHNDRTPQDRIIFTEEQERFV